MAAASSGGEADELIGEVARSEENEMGDAMAANARRKKKNKTGFSGKDRSHRERVIDRRRAESDE